ncbi:hypothetical protein QKW60_02690 [Defluviimonas aestuarii]|uniref:hypothetical protein n=1 Tax=Albidovulum aestuarii TaxID=1130726 RepID=UPI00249CB23A|nr:hypothetical protein [Defluviimonas aestuarii]MDI3335302.1 hypothetical protein [Defluviimonas aestuarii]
MDFITDNQLPLILMCFVVGCLFTSYLFRRHVSQKAWKIADLVWICLGGIGALTAVIAGVYAEDSSRLSRQIDIAYATTREFDRDAARFRLAHCEVNHPAATFRTAIRDLCDKVEFLSASTAGNAQLPLFIAVTERAAPLQGLNLFFGSKSSDMEDEVESFDMAEFLAFEPRDAMTEAAVALLRQAPSVAGIAAEFQVIAKAYEDLIGEVMHLRDEWQVLEDSAGILTLQILALCLVAFAAPFRLGKSIVDLI